MNDSELDQLLKLDEANVPLHAGFQREVWQRIRLAEEKSWRVRAAAFAGLMLDSLARPRVAFAMCAAMALAGAWIGWESVNPAHQAGGELAYVEAISPFAQTHEP
jgi:hypothetical protein